MFTTYAKLKDLKDGSEFPIILINLNTFEIVDNYRNIDDGIRFLANEHDIHEIISNPHTTLQILDKF